jgi:hypothetical protein
MEMQTKRGSPETIGPDSPDGYQPQSITGLTLSVSCTISEAGCTRGILGEAAVPSGRQTRLHFRL